MTYLSTVPDQYEATSSRLWIPGGGLGIELTVVRMRWLVRRALGRPLVLETARSLVYGSDSRLEAAERIRDYLGEHVHFVPDPLGTELLKSPRYMLREIQLSGHATGDCDDVAVLGAAFGGAVGLRARFVLLAFTERQPYEHVFTELDTGRGWLELDTTRPHQLPSGLRIVRTGFRGA